MPRPPEKDPLLAIDTLPADQGGPVEPTVRTRLAGTDPAVSSSHASREDATVPTLGISREDASVPAEPSPVSQRHDTVTAVVELPESFAWEDRLLELECQVEVAAASDQVRLLLEMGDIHWNKLDDREAAMRAYEQALRLDPLNEPAFEALGQIYYLEWKTEKLVELLIDRSQHLSDPRGQAALLGRVADLYEQLNQPEKAIIALEAARGADPENQTVIRRLAELTRPPEPTQLKDQLTVLRDQLELVSSEAERIDLYERMAVLHRERSELEAAAHCLEQVLALDPRRESCYRRLEQIYQDARQPRPLAAVLRRHAELAGPEERLVVLHRLATLLEGDLGDSGQALETYEQMLALEPAHPAALKALARLGEQTGAFGRAAQALAELARRERNPAARVELLHRLACLQLDRLGEPEAAEASFLAVLELAPGHPKTVARLSDLYAARRDFGKALRLLLEAEGAASSPPERARLLYQAGLVAREGLDDEERAAQLFERVLALDPDHFEAARPLAETYWRQKRHAECLPALEVVLRKADPADHSLIIETQLRLGAVTEALGEEERAVKHYRQALRLDPNCGPALLALARFAQRAGRWAEARSFWERLRAALDRLSRDERVEVHHSLGRCLEQLGERESAIRELQRALELQPDHAPSVEALAGLQVESSNWQAVVELKAAQLARAGPQQRARLHREIGEILWRRLGQPERAAQAYLEALKSQPEHHGVLHDLIDLYSETGQWSKTVEMCTRMAELEADPGLRAKYYFTVAVIWRDRLGDPDHAIEHFERVLDLDPGQLTAFEAIDALCTSRRAWKQLERSYARMISRLPTEGAVPLRVMLWHNLGEILRSRRRDFERAAAAFEAAARLDPANTQRLQIVAELYLSLGTSYREQAIRAHHRLLLREPTSPKLLHTLRQLYMEAGLYDRAWCLCMALAVLKQADREEQGFYQQYRRPRLPQARSALTDELWRHNVYHQDQRLALNAIFALLQPVLSAMTALPAAQFGLKPAERREPAHDRLACVRIFDQATALLQVPRADLYIQPRRTEPLLLAHTKNAPTFAVGAPLLNLTSEKELAFIIGKQLCYLRPEHFLRSALASRGQLQTALLAAVMLVQPALAVPEARARALAPIMERFQRQLQPAAREQLAHCVRHFQGGGPTAGELNQWWRALDLTSDRVGLILCNDLEVATALIARDRSPGEVAAADRIKELLRYACSEAYLALRERIGLSIG